MAFISNGSGRYAVSLGHVDEELRPIRFALPALNHKAKAELAESLKTEFVVNNYLQARQLDFKPHSYSIRREEGDKISLSLAGVWQRKAGEPSLLRKLLPVKERLGRDHIDFDVSIIAGSGTEEDCYLISIKSDQLPRMAWIITEHAKQSGDDKLVTPEIERLAEVFQSQLRTGRVKEDPSSHPDWTTKTVASERAGGEGFVR